MRGLKLVLGVAVCLAVAAVALAAEGAGAVIGLRVPEKKEIAIQLVSAAENSSLDWKAH